MCQALNWCVPVIGVPSRESLEGHKHTHTHTRTHALTNTHNRRCRSTGRSSPAVVALPWERQMN